MKKNTTIIYFPHNQQNKPIKTKYDSINDYEDTPLLSPSNNSINTVLAFAKSHSVVKFKNEHCFHLINN